MLQGRTLWASLLHSSLADFISLLPLLLMLHPVSAYNNESWARPGDEATETQTPG